jgi:hypothetical protein
VTCFLFTRTAAPVQEETVVPVLAGTVLPVREETAVPVLAETVLPVQEEIRLADDRPCTAVPVRKKKLCWLLDGPLIVVRFLFFFLFLFHQDNDYPVC